MVAATEVESIKTALASDKRDVADLWTDALRKYKGIVGEDLVARFESVDAMIAFGTQEMNSFHRFRHNEKKVDKLRSLFAGNLDYIVSPPSSPFIVVVEYYDVTVPHGQTHMRSVLILWCGGR
jgi:hypothetical protein